MSVPLLAAALAAVALLVFKKSGNFFRAFAASALGGLGSLCAVGAVSYFVPLSLGLNWYAVFFACLFSVPGVITMLLAKAFFL